MVGERGRDAADEKGGTKLTAGIEDVEVLRGQYEEERDLSVVWWC
jgi:hypothetical protein